MLNARACTFLLLLPLLTTTDDHQLTKQDHDYTYLDMVLQWPPGACFNFSYCREKIPSTWVVHGLWPSVNYTSFPTNCNTCSDLDLDSLPHKLVKQMKKQWPDFYQGTDGTEKLWKHEYCKHGTCCEDVLASPADYFQV